MKYPSSIEEINNEINEFCGNNVLDKEFKNINFLFTIPDIHGDVMALIDILSVYNFIEISIDKYELFDMIQTYKYVNICEYIDINPKLQNIVLVQTGDILDGYRTAPSMYDYYYNHDEEALNIMLKLQDQANNLHRNVHVILLYGNHEMNNLKSMKQIKQYEIEWQGREPRHEERTDYIYNNWKNRMNTGVKLYTNGDYQTLYKIINKKDVTPPIKYYDILNKINNENDFQNTVVLRYERFKKILQKFICQYMSIVKINDVILSHTIITPSSVKLLFRFAKRLYYYTYVSNKNLFREDLSQEEKNIKKKIQDRANTIFDENKISLYQENNKLQDIVNSYIRYIIYVIYKVIFIDINTYDNLKSIDYSEDIDYSKREQTYLNNDIAIFDDTLFDKMEYILYRIFAYDPFSNRDKIDKNTLSKQLTFNDSDDFLNTSYDDLDIYPENIYYDSVQDPVNIKKYINRQIIISKIREEDDSEENVYKNICIPNDDDAILKYYNKIINDTMNLYKVNKIFIGHIPECYTIKHNIIYTNEKGHSISREIIYGDTAHSRSFINNDWTRQNCKNKLLIVYQFIEVDYKFGEPFFNKDYKYDAKIFIST